MKRKEQSTPTLKTLKAVSYSHPQGDIHGEGVNLNCIKSLMDLPMNLKLYTGKLLLIVNVR